MSPPFHPTENAHTGFPSPADNYLQGSLDLNEHLIYHREATFFFRAKGNGMASAGIFDKDLLIVDRSLSPVSGNIVIVVIDGELTVKRLITSEVSYTLTEDNPLSDIHPKEGEELQIWGVVTSAIKKFL